MAMQMAPKRGASIVAALATKTDDLTPVEKAQAQAAEVGADAAYQPLVKSVDERRYTLGVAFAADRPERQMAQDGKRDVIKAQAIEDAAWAFLAKGREIGVFHQGEDVEKGTVVESYVWRGPEWSLSAADGSQQVIKAGDWLLGVVWSPGAWTLVKAGLIEGLSPQGRALRRPATTTETTNA